MIHQTPLALWILLSSCACNSVSANAPVSCEAQDPDGEEEERRAVFPTSAMLQQRKSEIQSIMQKNKRRGRLRHSIKVGKRDSRKLDFRYKEHNQQWERMPGLKPMVSWIASSYSKCMQAEDGHAFKERKVQCLDVFSLVHADKRFCNPDESPCHSKPCTCPGVEVCVPLTKDTVKAECSDEDSTSDAMDMDEIGCLKSDAVANTSKFFDWTCMTAPGNETCRDGLPWFSRVLPVMTPPDCFRFCTSKGLDLFGILDGKECRCGASNANLATFHEETPRKAILFDRMKLKPCLTQNEVNIKVFRYNGHIQNTGVPVDLLAHTEEDMQYIFSIGLGNMIEYEGEMEDGGPPDNQAPALIQALPHCPDCNYNSIWPLRSPSPPQTPWPYLEFAEYVIISFRWANKGDTFAPYVEKAAQDVDDIRKEAYRDAIKEIARKTCVVMVEKTQAELEASGQAFVAVGVYQAGGCWAYPGYSGIKGYPLNMGWCNSGASQGSIIHENLHILGIAHMQKRPDATQNIEGHGPYLQMYWDQIPDQWKPQYTPQEGMYVGSQYDGAGDPFTGWAPYDYGSIMHYGKSHPTRFDTIPEGHAVGQRSELSPGDIMMINDLYQCKEKESTAMPMPAPTPTPTKKVPEDYDWWVKDGPCRQSEDLSCVTSPNYPLAYSKNQKCEIDVKTNDKAITVEDWAVEGAFDKVMVNGQAYSGATKPNGVVPAENIIWTSDGSQSKKGWKICLLSGIALGPTPEPTAPTPEPIPEVEEEEKTVPPTPAPAAAWIIKSGDCEVCSENPKCLTSPNYPEYYDNSGKCTIGVVNESPITVQDWTTESKYDTLKVNDKKYAQEPSLSTTAWAQLNGVIPTADLEWTADNAQNYKGWKICVGSDENSESSTLSPTPELKKSGSPSVSPALELLLLFLLAAQA